MTLEPEFEFPAGGVVAPAVLSVNVVPVPVADSSAVVVPAENPVAAPVPAEELLLDEEAGRDFPVTSPGQLKRKDLRINLCYKMNHAEINAFYLNYVTEKLRDKVSTLCVLSCFICSRFSCKVYKIIQPL